MYPRPGRTAWALALAGLLVACDGPDDPEGDDDHKHEHDDDCDDGNGLDEYYAGISATTVGGLYAVAIIDADPAPPDVDDNDWDLSVTYAADDAPFTEGIVRIRPWMPLHGHGTSPQTYNAVHVEDDRWRVEGINLIMPGLWELNVEIFGPDGSDEDEDELMFRFCARG